jgi:hypothetical protein
VQQETTMQTVSHRRGAVPIDSIVLYDEPRLIFQANFGAKRSNTMAFHKSRKRVRPSPDAEIDERARAAAGARLKGILAKQFRISRMKTAGPNTAATRRVGPSITVDLIGNLLPPFWQNHLDFSE